MHDGCGDRRPCVPHMWPATRVEAAAPPPPPKGPAASPRASLPPLRTASYPPAPTTPPPAPAAQKQEEGLLSPRPASADFFLKVPTGGKPLWDLLSSMCYYTTKWNTMDS
jgi:hypothetical protein